MNIDKYRTFLACVESRTFFDAAELLYTTPSTVSKHISSLEQELGCTLFDRTPKGLSLTYAGKLRLPIIQEIVTTNDRLEHIGEDNVPIEQLSVCSIPFFSRFHLGDMVSSFSARYPSINPVITEQRKLKSAIEEKKIEFGFLYMTPDLDPSIFDVVEFPMGFSGIMVRRDSPFAGMSSVSLSSLAGKTLISQGTIAMQYIFNSYFRLNGVKADIDYQSGREDLLILQVQNEDKIALTTSDIWGIYQPEDVTFIPFSEKCPCFGELVRLHEVPLSRNARYFWNFAKNWLVEKRDAVILYN